MSNITKDTWVCDGATGDLYENGHLVGKLITATSGAWVRLLSAANGNVVIVADPLHSAARAEDAKTIAALSAERDEQAHTLKFVRAALDCDESTTETLVKAIEHLQRHQNNKGLQ